MRFIGARVASVLAATVALAACVQPPVAPMIPVAPGPNKSFDAFATDQAFCQSYASAQTAPAVAAANNQALGGALLTTALGAGIGAAVGGGHAAGIGAASGAGLGTLVGAGNSSFAQMSVQQQYDILYGQCMAAHGNSVAALSAPAGTPPYQGGSMGPLPYQGGPMGPPPYQGGPMGPPPYQGGSMGPPPYQGGSMGPPSYQGGSMGPPSYQDGSMPPPGYSALGYYPGAAVPPPPGY
jgi:outer membrane lipoprotein SlyB